MKKFLSISLLFLYLISSVGVTISLHYCGGGLAALGVFSTPSCCCDEEKQSRKDDCCKNENKSFKITADQNKVGLSEVKYQSGSLILPVESKPFFTERSIFRKISLSPVVLPHPPNRCNLIPVYKRNHSFLYYS